MAWRWILVNVAAHPLIHPLIALSPGRLILGAEERHVVQHELAPFGMHLHFSYFDLIFIFEVAQHDLAPRSCCTTSNIKINIK
jgi:hypothetical protein